jgi:hypothetical protein
MSRPGAGVDGEGCSQEQFCKSVDVSTGPGRAGCSHSDWQNDEPLGLPRDCTFDRAAGLCAPR